MSITLTGSVAGGLNSESGSGTVTLVGGVPGPNLITATTATDLEGLLYGDGALVEAIPLTTYSRSLLGLADAAAGRLVLGLGTASLLDASNVPLLNAANVFTQTQTLRDVTAGASSVSLWGNASTVGLGSSGLGPAIHLAFNNRLAIARDAAFAWSSESQTASGTPDTTATRPTAGQLRLSRLGTNGESSVLSFAGPSSLGTLRDVAVLTSGFATATDASFQGQFSIGVRGIVGATDALQTGLTMTALASGGPEVTIKNLTVTNAGGGLVLEATGARGVRVGNGQNFVDSEVRNYLLTTGGVVAIQVASDRMYGWCETTNSYQAADLALGRNAAGVVEVNNGTPGAFRDLLCRVVRTNPVTVAALPSAASAGRGAIAYVTDANSTTRRAIAVGGGSNEGPVHSDGTNWLIT